MNLRQIRGLVASLEAATSDTLPDFAGIEMFAKWRARRSVDLQRLTGRYGRRQFCSVTCRSLPTSELTVSAIKPTFGSATGAGPSVSFTGCS